MALQTQQPDGTIRHCSVGGGLFCVFANGAFFILRIVFRTYFANRAILGDLPVFILRLSASDTRLALDLTRFAYRRLLLIEDLSYPVAFHAGSKVEQIVETLFTVVFSVIFMIAVGKDRIAVVAFSFRDRTHYMNSISSL